VPELCGIADLSLAQIDAPRHRVLRKAGPVLDHFRCRIAEHTSALRGSFSYVKEQHSWLIECSAGCLWMFGCDCVALRSDWGWLPRQLLELMWSSFTGSGAPFRSKPGACHSTAPKTPLGTQLPSSRSSPLPDDGSGVLQLALRKTEGLFFISKSYSPLKRGPAGATHLQRRHSPAPAT
jgi:hypothetical protein